MTHFGCFLSSRLQLVKPGKLTDIKRVQKNSLEIIMQDEYPNYENAFDIIGLCGRKEVVPLLCQEMHQE